MSLEGSGSQKHLGVDQRRCRFDPKSRYGGRGGASLVKSRPKQDISVVGYSQIHLDVERPLDADGHTLVSKLDQDIPGLVSMYSEKDLPAELALQLPGLLDDICIAKKTERGKERVVATTYTVEGMVPTEEERLLLEQRRAARLTLLIQKGDETRTRVFCKITDAPLKTISEKTLLDSHTRLISPCHVGISPQRFRVFNESSYGCFDAFLPSRRASYLELDLGADCEVTHVSTQGRFPDIMHSDTTTGSRVVRDSSATFNNWVTSYELSYRQASDKVWVSEELKGNSDMTTEVAHELASSGWKASVRCRYLRFRPLTYNRVPAMRIGVYGRRLGEEASHKPSALEGDHVIHYTIHRVLENINTRRVPVGFGLCRYGCAKCTKMRGQCALSRKSGPKARRINLRAGTVEEARRLLPSTEGRSPLVSVEEDEGDAIETAVEPAEADPQAFQEPLPPLPTWPLGVRRHRRANPDVLSSAASSDGGSTLGDSAVLVPELGNELCEEDDWLIAGVGH